jgi:thiol-disulfide isomerase/thioredoxin
VKKFLMRGSLNTLLAVSAACALVAGGAHASAAPRRPSPAAQKRSTPRPKSKAATAKPAAKATAARPQVRAIDEAGLKAIMEESAKNKRLLLVNFWATWCTPCREEFPDLVKIDEEFAALTDFEFITVSLDEPSEIEKSVPQFLAEMRAGSIPAYLFSTEDAGNLIALIYKDWRGDLPATFLFGRAGEVVFKHTGRVKPEELRAAIRANASPAPAAPADK